MTTELTCTAQVKVITGYDNLNRPHYRLEKCNLPAQQHELAGELTKVKAVLCGTHAAEAVREIAAPHAPDTKGQKSRRKLEKAGQINFLTTSK